MSPETQGILIGAAATMAESEVKQDQQAKDQADALAKQPKAPVNGNTETARRSRMMTLDKSAGTRHIEHGQFKEQLDQLYKHSDEMVKTISDFMVAQSEKLDGFHTQFINEVRSLERAMTQKTEMDSAILRRQDEQERRMEGYEEKQEKTSELLTQSATILNGLKESIAKDMQNAHSSLRSHKDYHINDLEPRIDALEKKGGNAALAFLKYIGTAAGALFLAWLAGRLGVKMP